jgi:hypothetical protein
MHPALQIVYKRAVPLVPSGQDALVWRLVGFGWQVAAASNNNNMGGRMINDQDAMTTAGSEADVTTVLENCRGWRG